MDIFVKNFIGSLEDEIQKHNAKNPTKKDFYLVSFLAEVKAWSTEEISFELLKDRSVKWWDNLLKVTANNVTSNFWDTEAYVTRRTIFLIEAALWVKAELEFWEFELERFFR